MQNVIINKVAFFSILLGLVGFAIGCDSSESSLHEEEIVVESYLVVDEPLPPVWLSKSIPVNATFSTAGTALKDASVRIHLLTAQGGIERTYDYEESPEELGAYHSVQNDAVLGGRTYRLEVDGGPNFERVTAETTTPEGFELIAPSAEEIAYQDPSQYSMLVTQSAVKGGQNVFVFTMESLDPTIENLVPIYFRFIFDKDIEEIDTVEWTMEDLQEVLVYSSPPISEGNYEVFDNGTLRVKLPWFAVAFYGPLKVTMTVLDRNLFDFQRYQQVQQGGSTLSPGEIPNVRDHIENGRGLFGSSARVSHTVTILRESSN